MSADAAGTADVPTSALDAVLLESVDMPEGTPTVKGYDFEGTLDLQALLDSMLTSGFQATQFGYAVDEVNKMLKWRLSDEPVPEDADEEERDPAYRAGVRTKIFLGFTSNLISSGVREQLKFLMKHKMVDVLVTTAGGVEEDLIKALTSLMEDGFRPDEFRDHTYVPLIEIQSIVDIEPGLRRLRYFDLAVLNALGNLWFHMPFNHRPGFDMRTLPDHDMRNVMRHAIFYGFRSANSFPPGPSYSPGGVNADTNPDVLMHLPHDDLEALFESFHQFCRTDARDTEAYRSWYDPEA